MPTKRNRAQEEKSAEWTPPRLQGKVAVVAGATRGAGRGIARALGEAGAIVYCTGRSVRGQPSPYNRPETIEETAELVTAAGGTGLAVRVDHTVEAEVRGLFARVEAEQGRLDVLVNSVAGEDPTFNAHQPLAEIDIEQGLGLMRQAVFSHLLTVKHAVPLLVRTRKGLIIELTEGDTLSGGASLLLHLVKVLLKHLAFVLAAELRKHKIAVVSVTPGFMRSENVLDALGVTEENWRDGGKKDPNFLESETPLFIGRGLAALAADPKALARSGDVTSSWELAKQYGVVDVDGRRPDWDRQWVQIMPAHRWLQEGFRREYAWLDQLAQRAGRYAGVATPKKTASRVAKGE